MFISTQVETEKVHFTRKLQHSSSKYLSTYTKIWHDCTCFLIVQLVTEDTASSQTWMNVLKMFLVLAVCAGQVYMTTSFFNRGNQGRRMQNDINPFAKSSIWVTPITQRKFKKKDKRNGRPACTGLRTNNLLGDFYSQKQTHTKNH